jgi:hypothetical protein
MSKESWRLATNRRYVVQRTLLIQLMGGKCVYCPKSSAETRLWELEFHHTVQPNWRPAKTSRHRRIRLYARDWGNGELVLACGTCNKKLGQPPPRAGESEIPF